MHRGAFPSDCGRRCLSADGPSRHTKPLDPADRDVGSFPPVVISTMNDLPGYEIEEVFGEVFGLTVRSRNLGSQIGAGLKSLVGGELKGMTKMLQRVAKTPPTGWWPRRRPRAPTRSSRFASTPPSSARPGPRSAPTDRRQSAQALTARQLAYRQRCLGWRANPRRRQPTTSPASAAPPPSMPRRATCSRQHGSPCRHGTT